MLFDRRGHFRWGRAERRRGGDFGTLSLVVVGKQRVRRQVVTDVAAAEEEES